MKLGPGWKAAALTTGTGAVLWGLFRFGLLDTERIWTAFARHRGLLVLSVACLLAMSVVGVVRHMLALSAFGVPIPWQRVTAANLISQAVGQWAPGSMAVSEVLRIGMLLGGAPAGADRAQTVARIAMASLVDRIVGLGVMFCLGTVTALTAMYTGGSASQRAPLLVLALATLLMGAALLALPFAGDTRPMHWLIKRLRAADSSLVLIVYRERVAASLAHIQVASAQWTKSRGALVGAVLLSLASSVLNPLTLYLAGLATGGIVPFVLVAAVLPATIANVILPIGVAGFGGPQLVSVALFTPFGVSAETVVAMSLVQNTLVLAVQTTLGIIWAAWNSREIGAILRRR